MPMPVKDRWSLTSSSLAPTDIAAVLRRSGGDPKWVEAFATWESVRAALAGSPRYEPTCAAQAGAKTVLLFDGIPGAGKTTHLERIRQSVGAGYLSMARFAERLGTRKFERWNHQRTTGALHPVDAAFLDAVEAAGERFVILEKFARTPVEAAALVERARRAAWRLEVIHLDLSGSGSGFGSGGDPVAASVRRQLERGPHHGREVGPDEARSRALQHLARCSSGRWMLEELGVPVHAIPSGGALEENHRRVRQVLGLDFAQLDWEVGPLRELEEVGRALGIDAWVGAGTLYRPFWNGRFGPVQAPNDVDVAVHAQAEVEPLLAALDRRFPLRRWSVMCPSERLRRKYGIRTASLHEAKGLAKVAHKAGAVRWNAQTGEVEVRLSPGSEAALWNGVVRINERLLDAVSAESLGAGDHRAALLANEAEGALRTLLFYPALRVDPRTVALLRAEGPHRPVSAWVPRPVVTAWKPLKAQVIAQPRRTRGVAPARRRLVETEREIALEILRLHRDSDHRPSAPPSPVRAALPEPLEALRRARERKKAGLSLSGSERALLSRGAVPPPAGSSSWLHHLGLWAQDDVFGDWFLHQARHDAPMGGADPLVRGVLDFSLFAPRLKSSMSCAQSPMHQGWPLQHHLAGAVLALQTDALLASLREEGHDEEWLRALRLSLRVALLFHDVGKLVAPEEPRRHGRISARLWMQHRPEWFPPQWVPTVAWMITTHDLFGAFGRGLTDKQGHAPADYDGLDLSRTSAYPGALDAQAVRRALGESGWPLPLAVAVNKAIWTADVGAISSLRWLLPVADPIERLLLAVPARPERRAVARGPREQVPA